MIYKISLFIVLGLNALIWHDFSHVVIPLHVVSAEKMEIERIAAANKIDITTAKGIYYAARANNLDPNLYAMLVKSESDFRPDAVSRKNYKGIAQTPTATGRVKTDLMHGAEILAEKLKYTGGNMEAALQLYKGGKNQQAKRQARRVYLAYLEHS